MRRTVAGITLLAFAVVLYFGEATRAGHGRCSHCRCPKPCNKICRLVCEERDVEIVCWGCACEHFCIPKKSKRLCKHKETVCIDCDQGKDPNGVCSVPRKFVWWEWRPTGCARMFTKHKLMKRVEKRKLPSYKWVVEDLCQNCETKCAGADIQPGVEIPPPPVKDAKILVGQILDAEPLDDELQ